MSFLKMHRSQVHIIACPLCREKYGNTNGKQQEEEGVPLVKAFLSDSGMMSVLEIIKGRRSVRTFDGRDLSREDREKLEQYIPGICNPFEEQGKKPEVVVNDPGIAISEDMEYIATVQA